MPTDFPTFTNKYKYCPTNCQEHAFIITPRQPSKAWIKNEIKIEYCPIQTEYGLQNIIPNLNCDQLQYLPGFIIEYDQADYQNDHKKYIEEHEKKLLDYTTKKKIINIPKPGRKHRYCGVCRRQYEEYLQHIQSPDHISNFNNHKYVSSITNLIKGTYGSSNIQNDKPKVFKIFVIQSLNKISYSSESSTVDKQQNQKENVSKRKPRVQKSAAQKKESKREAKQKVSTLQNEEVPQHWDFLKHPQFLTYLLKHEMTYQGSLQSQNMFLLPNGILPLLNFNQLPCPSQNLGTLPWYQYPHQMISQIPIQMNELPNPTMAVEPDQEGFIEI